MSGNKGLSRLGAALTGAGAAALWAFSRGTWVSAVYEDTLAGGGTAMISGAEWSAELTAVALLLLVGTIGLLSLRRVGRRIVGAVSALAALGAAVSPATLLLRGVDPERAHAILSSGSDGSATGATTAAISEWADITAVDTANLFPVLTLLGCLLAVVGGVCAVARPGEDAPKMNKYEKEAVRREHIREDLDARPDSGRVMWDALDADIDPTEDASRG